jgi:hypothetical protein
LTPPQADGCILGTAGTTYGIDVIDDVVFMQVYLLDNEYIY